MPKPGQRINPPINILPNLNRLGTFIPHRNTLALQLRAVDIAVRIHRLLQRVILPPEDVIPVGPVTGGIPLAPHKWLLSGFLRPEGFIVERGRVPDYFVEKLGDLDGMGGRAGAVGFECPGGRVGYVGCVIRGVEVFAVPAAVR